MVRLPLTCYENGSLVFKLVEQNSITNPSK